MDIELMSGEEIDGIHCYDKDSLNYMRHLKTKLIRLGIY